MKTGFRQVMGRNDLRIRTKVLQDPQRRMVLLDNGLRQKQGQKVIDPGHVIEGLKVKSKYFGPHLGKGQLQEGVPRPDTENVINYDQTPLNQRHSETTLQCAG